MLQDGIPQPGEPGRITVAHVDANAIERAEFVGGLFFRRDRAGGFLRVGMGKIYGSGREAQRGETPGGNLAKRLLRAQCVAGGGPHEKCESCQQRHHHLGEVRRVGTEEQELGQKRERASEDGQWVKSAFLGLWGAA